jgi:hypothetical protein
MKHQYPILVGIIVSILISLLFTQVGWAFALIVGGSAVVAYVLWLLTTYKNPVDGNKILPFYLVAVAMQYIHMTEEFVAGFPHAFSSLTGSKFESDTFVLISLLLGGIVYMLTGYGLLRRHPVANYLLWFFLIGPAGLVNTIAHVTFPFFAGGFYFPGLITVLLPTISGSLIVWEIFKGRQQKAAKPQLATSA